MKLSELAKHYGKARAAFLPSGYAALELALELCGVTAGDLVAVPANVCFLVPASITRRGALPVFVCGEPLPEAPQYELALRLHPRICCLLVVHQHGLPADVSRIREASKGRALIEDAAQAFGLTHPNWRLGESSDFVVTSFGATKPLSLGWGGALFADTELPAPFIDTSRRLSKTAPPSYLLPDPDGQAVERAWHQARARLEHRRAFVAELTAHPPAAGLEFYAPPAGCAPSWTRLPFWPSPRLDAELAAANDLGDLVQRPHAVPLPELPMFRGAPVVSDEDGREPPLLLRTTGSATAARDLLAGLGVPEDRSGSSSARPSSSQHR